MNAFELFCPVNLIYGPGEVSKVGQVVKHYGKRVLIVTYQDIGFYGDLFPRIHQALEAEGLVYEDCLVATANPKISEAKQAIEMGRKMGADVLIGVGGGSAMDLTKVVAAGLCYPHEDIRRMIRFTHSDDSYQIPPTEALPFVLIPTLPATASEMNPTAVITDDETLRKSYIWEPKCLYAKASILDPELTLSLPAYQTACGAVDALSHVMEPFLYSDEATYGNISLHDNMQLGVMKTIWENTPKIMADPNNVELRGMMQFSATVGLNGWLTCGTQGFTPMHQLGHVLSSHFKATHGATLACMIPAWMRHFADRPQNERFKLLAEELFHTESILESADIFEEYCKNLGIETRISQFGCTEKDLDALAQGVVDVSFLANGTLGSIPAITKEEVRHIYELSL